MDRAVMAALRRRDELTKEMADLNTFLEVYRRFGGDTNGEQSEWVTSVPNAPDDAAGDAVAGKHTIIRNTRSRRKSAPADIAAMAERIIREVLRPMNRAELVEALEDRDVEIPSADRVNYIGTTLWRHANEKLINLPGKGYWLRDVDYAPADYVAGRHDVDEDVEEGANGRNDESEEDHTASEVPPPPPPPPPPRASITDWVRAAKEAQAKKADDDISDLL